MGYVRGFLAQLRYRFARFMQGRYGVDQLYRALFIAYLVTFVLQMVWHPLSLLGWVLIGVMLFRCFSKNIAARQRENAAWMRAEQSIRRWWKLNRNRWRDRHTHIYCRCPHCKAVIRLPRSKKGQRICNCPRCRQDFSVKIR